MFANFWPKSASLKFILLKPFQNGVFTSRFPTLNEVFSFLEGAHFLLILPAQKSSYKAAMR